MHKDYSQNGEQEIILNFFQGYTGTLLSFGENDGETLSNCRALMLEGWEGVFVEPSPPAAEKLRELYRDNNKAIVFQIAASNYDGHADFFHSGSHLQQGDTSLLSTLNLTDRNRWQQEEFSTIQVGVMDAIRFNRFEADFISIDAEGEDIKILKRLTLKNCKLLCIEWNRNENTKRQIEQIISHKKFKLLHQNAENLIYKKL